MVSVKRSADHARIGVAEAIGRNFVCSHALRLYPEFKPLVDVFWSTGVYKKARYRGPYRSPTLTLIVMV